MPPPAPVILRLETHMQLARSRTGFTLVEMVAALALVAVLSALLTPTLTRHLGRGSRHRVTSDLRAIANATSQFYLNVERWPASAEQLETRIRTTDQDLFRHGYPPAMVDAWKGPYLTRSTVGGALATGDGAAISARFDTLTWNGSVYLRISSGGVDQETARAISLDVDGDTVVGSTGLENAAGRIRWKAGAVDSMVFLARPLGR